MKKKSGAIISLILCAVMISGSVINTCAVTGSDPADDCFMGIYYNRPNLELTTDNVDSYVYSDRFFCGTSYNYNESLATMSMVLAAASVGSLREPYNEAGYLKKSRNITSLLSDTGFSDIEINDDFTVKPSKDTCGAVCAHKRVQDNGMEYTLLVIAPRSADYEAEWGNNFVLGQSGDAAGFSSAADHVLEYAKQYISSHKLAGRLKIWTAGYSRGAAVSNLLAARLVDEPERYLGDAVSFGTPDLYAYTFGTPTCADVNNDPHADRYGCIHNHRATDDAITYMAPEDMGFSRYGIDHILNDKDTDSEMSRYLKIAKESVWEDLFVNGEDSDSFKPQKFAITDGGIKPVNDDNSYMPSDMSEYLSGLMSWLTIVAEGRENYAAKYEQMISDLLAYTLSLNSDQMGAMLNAIVSDKSAPKAILSMYAYYMHHVKDISDNNTIAATGAVSDATAVTAAITDIFADSDLLSAQNIAQYAVDLVNYLYFKSGDECHSLAAAYLKIILESGLDASGATEEFKTAMLSDSNMMSLSYLASYLLLGNKWQSGSYDPLNIGNEQLSNLATLIGNFKKFTLPHYNEVQVSRLRVKDPLMTQYATLTKDQKLGYRRVYIRGAYGINGKITRGKDTVALIENGRVKSSSDMWVGFTNTDDGGFFRIPSDGLYMIELNAPSDCELDVRIAEVTADDSKEVSQYTDTVSAVKDDTIYIALPYTSESLPSTADYCVTLNKKPYILGDSDADGEVSVLDATAIQRVIAQLTGYDSINTEAADCDGDSEISILDATAIQRYIALLPCPAKIGRLLS